MRQSSRTAVPRIVELAPPPSRPPFALIVDDVEWSARAYESVLGSGGFAVLRVANGSLSRRLATPASAAEEPLPQLRAGCCAVDDFAAAGAEPVDLLIRATTALRRAQREGGELAVHSP